MAFSIWEGSIMHHWDLPYLPLRDCVLSKRSAFVSFGPPRNGCHVQGRDTDLRLGTGLGFLM